MTDSARDAILRRIRQALKRPAPEPYWANDPIQEGPVFPLPANEPQALRDRMKKEFEAIQGEWHEAGSREEARQWLTDWMAEQGLKTILAPKTENTSLCRFLEGMDAITWADPALQSGPHPHAGWDKLDLGITLVESLVAESGSLLVSTQIAGRASSVLPPHHLAIATADQIVPDLDSALGNLQQKYAQIPSSASLITGPSRTADIEKILVLGVHGPRRLTLLVLPAGSL